MKKRKKVTAKRFAEEVYKALADYVWPTRLDACVFEKLRGNRVRVTLNSDQEFEVHVKRVR